MSWQDLPQCGPLITCVLHLLETHEKNMKDKDFWYTLNNVRSYNALFNFIILLRGVGKTFAFKEFAIREAIEKGKLFMYLRRTEVELRDSMDSFTRDVCNKFPEYEFKISRNSLMYNKPDSENEGQYIDRWQTAGYFAYLSNSRRKKSVSYEGVTYMAFDEFLIPPGDKYAAYLPDEVTTFFEFYETVARMRDVQVFFLSNAMSTVNPYFLFFKLRLPKNKSGILRISDEIVVEYHDNEEYRKAKQETRFGKIIAGTRFADYAVNNQFVDEDMDYIKKKPGNAYYHFTISIGDTVMGVYKVPREEEWFISNNVNPQCPFRYKYKGTDTGYRMFKTRKAVPQINRLINSFQQGLVFFENQTIKQVMLEFFERTM